MSSLGSWGFRGHTEEAATVWSGAGERGPVQEVTRALMGFTAMRSAEIIKGVGMERKELCRLR